ncbi:MAG: DUF1707 SHOCT-like domain-containing protein [Streptosporangiaceae bacterium]
MMDDRMRVSDADREQVTARLREHFAEGRLNSDELDERVTAALNAKTFGDLGRVMADLPDTAMEPGPVPQSPPWAARPRLMLRRGPRLLPLALILLIAAVAIPGAGWLFIAFLKAMLVLWLVAIVAGVFVAARFRRRMRGHWQSGWNGPWNRGGPWDRQNWHHYQWHN